MSREVERGRVVFSHVDKEYGLGYRRAFLTAMLPFGRGIGGGRHLKALDDVSFEIEPGESFALLGHNGAGKSTALKCLSGVTRPSAGLISVGGRISALIELGVGFHPDLSGIENLKFVAAIAGVRGADAKRAVDAAIAFAEIDDFLDTPVKRYSSGMVARIGFGIATALPGDVLVVDEVLAVGDAAFQRKCQRLLADLRRDEGRTLLFVSHNEWVVKETCTRAALLDHGKVVCVDEVQSALRAYAVLQQTAGPGEIVADGGGLVRLGHVAVHPDDVRLLAPQDPIAATCDVDVSPEAEQPVVAMCLLNESGQILWGVYSDELGIELPHGRSQVTISVDRLSAAPGSCRLQVFTFDRALPLVDEVRTLHLESAGGVTGGLEHGVVRVAATMTIDAI